MLHQTQSTCDYNSRNQSRNNRAATETHARTHSPFQMRVRHLCVKCGDGAVDFEQNANDFHKKKREKEEEEKNDSDGKSSVSFSLPCAQYISAVSHGAPVCSVRVLFLSRFYRFIQHFTFCLHFIFRLVEIVREICFFRLVLCP